MIEIKDEKIGKIMKFCELQNGDIFEYADSVCKNILYIKTNNFSTGNVCIYNSINIINGKFVFVEESANVLKVKLICEVKYIK